MDDVTATTCLGQLCSMLRRPWGVRPVVLPDEYDTPLQEAWLSGHMEPVGSFVRRLLDATFKTNPDLGRALATGITRVASESIFSDMYNPWSITNMLSLGEIAPYWANSSSSTLVSALVRRGGSRLKEDFETLLVG